MTPKRIALASLRAAPLIAVLAATAWALSTNPFARPFVDRGQQDLRAALDRAVARRASA